MSCYINKSNYNFLASRTSSGIRFLSFQDTKTEPETVLAIMRELLSESTGVVRRRPYQMFMMLNRKITAKPDITSKMVEDYINVTRAIFKPFINGYGRFNKNINYGKDLNDIRFKIARFLRRSTDCGDINIIFKTPFATFMEEEITFYINDSSIMDGKSSFEYNFDDVGLKLSKTSSLTMSIPVRYIKSVINKAYHQCSTELKQQGMKLEEMDNRLNYAIMNYIEKHVTKRLYKALCAALYKEYMFLTFSRDVCNVYSNLSSHRLGDKYRFSTPINSSDTIESLNYKLIEDLLRKNAINQLNPHLLLDMFEIYPNELDSFISQFVRDDNRDALKVVPPEYANLHLDSKAYIDEESRITSGLTFISKLNYCILALMMTTKNSIKESTRSQYCHMVKNGLSSVKSLSKISYVTRNKELLIKEVESQLDMMNDLADDIIKLKRYVERN